MDSGSIAAWTNVALVLMLAIIGGIAAIIKMLHNLDKRLDSFGLELHTSTSDLRADHKSLEGRVDKMLDDHEARLRSLERGKP